MTLKDILTQIEIECNFKKVGYLTDIEKIDIPEHDTPAAFFFWSNDSSQGNDGVGVLTNQPVDRGFSVLVVASVPEGDEDPLQDSRDELFAALSGFENGSEQILFTGGNVESINAGLIRWRDDYQFTIYLRNVRP